MKYKDNVRKKEGIFPGKKSQDQKSTIILKDNDKTITIDEKFAFFKKRVLTDDNFKSNDSNELSLRKNKLLRYKLNNNNLKKLHDITHSHG